MAPEHGVDWKAVHDVVVEVGREDCKSAVLRALLHRLEAVVPHDFAQLVVLGDQDPGQDRFARPYGIVSLESRDVPCPHRDRYPYYFARTDLRPTALPDRPVLFQAEESGFRGTEFGEDWCRPVRARHSAGLRFLDALGRPQVLVILYRERADLGFQNHELATLEALHPHIVNLCRVRSSPRPVAPEGFERLTPREREVADLLCQGLSTKALAWRLFIGEATAARHAHNLYAKLGIGSRQELLALVLRAQASHR
jgi:DNA-binding CsgD family transcriptional regulator